jgi:hypothetical protein
MKIILILFLVLINHLSFAQEKTSCAILYYGNKAISLKAPDGWVLDCESGLENGINAVLYKYEKTWQNAKTVMYVNFASFDIENQRNLNDLISYDSSTFKENYEGIKIDTKEKIELGQFKGIIKYFGGGTYKSFEYLAYLDLKEFAIMTVISSKSKSDLDANYLDFIKLLESITLIPLEFKDK